MGIIEAIGNGLKAFAAFFGYQQKKLELNNAPAMQARAAGETDQQIKDGAAKAVADGDLDKIRKDLAE